MRDSHARRFPHRISTILLCFAVSWMAIAFLPLPFLLIFPLWFVYFTAVSMRGKSRILRLVTFNIAMVLVLLGIGEVVSAVKENTGMIGVPLHPLALSPAKDDGKGTRETHVGRYDRYILADDRFGYAPTPNDRVRATRHENHEVVYDVVYNFDFHGLRVTPHDGESGGECILSFGGSFTFGQGVADDETLPSLVGQKTGGRFRVYNFGFHGYGPHQMLYALDHGVVEEVVECEPKFVIYQALHAHVKRSAGLTWWGRHGPRYVQGDGGESVYMGHFDDESAGPLSRQRSVAYEYLSRSRLFKEIHRGTVVYSENVDLLVDIVDAARRHVETRWPGAEFHVLYWDKRFQLNTLKLEWALFQRGFRMHLVSDILPDYFGNELLYQVSRADSHPNAMAFDFLADHIARQVLDGRDPPDGGSTILDVVPAAR